MDVINKNSILLSLIFLFFSASCFANSSTSAENTIVATDKGLVKGILENGIFTYKGIDYANAKRFEEATEVLPWEGVKEAINYGTISYQNESQIVNQNFLPSGQKTSMSDNPLNLNIWTPNLKSKELKPVMVWLHGGGLQTGSAYEQATYDGHNLAKKGNVVVVSINHRLNSIGFLNLADYGEKFKLSGENGINDIVMALNWIHKNIINFGGDPNNITLFGQSGGGAKILILMTTPKAIGLFDKVIIQSGAVENCGMTDLTIEQSKRITKKTLAKLSINQDNIEKIQTIDYEILSKAADESLREVAIEDNIVDLWGNVGLFWTPVVDGDYLPMQPVENKMSLISKDIPMLIGTNLTEWSSWNFMYKNPADKMSNPNNWSQDDINEFLTKRYGNKKQEIIEAFYEAYPNRSLIDLLFVDSILRPPALKTARLKAEQNGASVYNYIFSFETPVGNINPKSYHCAEIPFIFNNIDKHYASYLQGIKAFDVANKVSDIWIQFAKTGNPNIKDIPLWPAFNKNNGATMLIGDTFEVKYKHDYKLLYLLNSDYIF